MMSCCCLLTTKAENEASLHPTKTSISVSRIGIFLAETLFHLISS